MLVKCLANVLLLAFVYRKKKVKVKKVEMKKQS